MYVHIIQACLKNTLTDSASQRHAYSNIFTRLAGRTVHYYYVRCQWCLLLLLVVDAEHIELFVPNSCNMQQKSSVRGETKEEKIICTQIAARF